LSKRKYILLVDRNNLSKKLILFFFLNCQKENIFCWFIEIILGRILNILPEKLILFSFYELSKRKYILLVGWWIKEISGEPIPQKIFFSRLRRPVHFFLYDN